MEYQNCVNINASEAIIPSEVFMAIKTEPETLIEHGEVPDFDSDDSLLDPTYLRDEKPTSSRFLKQKGKRAKKEGSIVSPTSDSQSEINDANEHITNRISGANSILFNSFFSITEKRENTSNLKGLGGIIAQCRICFQKVKGSLRVSSNFVRHLRIRHAKEYDRYKHNKICEYQENSYRNFDKRVLMFLAATCSPLSVVESAEFRNLFKGFPVKVKSKLIMTNILEESHALWVLNTTKQLKEICYFCTTADVWSSRQRSFFGYTCHYITPDTLQRKHLALSCRRLPGSYTHEQIAKTVNQIHRDFGIDNNKIVLSITDNASNFCRSFKEFGIQRTLTQEGNDSDDDVEEINDELTNSNMKLPHNISSASHTLNLLATTDFLQIIKRNEKINFRHQQAFSRCSNIWRKCIRPKTAEIMQKVLAAELKTPSVTRWKTVYDSVKCLLKHKEKLLILCTELSVTKFSSLDIEYLESYSTLMEPVANAIDFLDGQEHMYFGYFIAAIISLKVKLQRLLESDSQGDLSVVCGDLLYALIQRFEVFFKGGEDAEVALLAGMSHPAVKLRFLPILEQTAPHLTSDVLKMMFVAKASTYSSATEETNTPKITSSHIGFLDFGEVDRSSKLVQNDSIRKELDMFLLDPETGLCSLNKYPLIKKMFLKFNTPLPSSAPVERFFSLSGMADAPRRNKLSDCNFEMLVLLKANSM